PSDTEGRIVRPTRSDQITSAMANTFARLTLYALLSAIEEDLRDATASLLSGQRSPEELLGDDLFSRATEKLKRDSGAEAPDSTFDQLLSYTDFGDLCQLLNRHSRQLPPDVATYARAITPMLEKLAPVRNRVMHSRPLDFDDLPLVT